MPYQEQYVQPRSKRTEIAQEIAATYLRVREFNVARAATTPTTQSTVEQLAPQKRRVILLNPAFPMWLPARDLRGPLYSR
jgi:hypothetical protein